MPSLTPPASTSLTNPFTIKAAYSRSVSRLPSGIPVLDDFLQGGLPMGALTEWGMPLGHGTREILMPWLARLTQQQESNWLLWIHSQNNLEINPSAWAARGIDLEHLRFARTSAPLRDLKPIFLEPLFKFIVIDSPQDFSDEDCAFIARQARRLQQTTLLLRNNLLRPLSSTTPKQSSHIWARLRLNTWRQPHLAPTSAMAPYGGLWVETIRGLPHRRLLLPLNIEASL